MSKLKNQTVSLISSVGWWRHDNTFDHVSRVNCIDVDSVAIDSQLSLHLYLVRIYQVVVCMCINVDITSSVQHILTKFFCRA